jgi:hypothetical protein
VRTVADDGLSALGVASRTIPYFPPLIASIGCYKADQPKKSRHGLTLAKRERNPWQVLNTGRDQE